MPHPCLKVALISTSRVRDGRPRRHDVELLMGRVPTVLLDLDGVDRCGDYGWGRDALD